MLKHSTGRSCALEGGHDVAVHQVRPQARLGDADDRQQLVGVGDDRVLAFAGVAAGQAGCMRSATRSITPTGCAVRGLGLVRKPDAVADRDRRAALDEQRAEDPADGALPRLRPPASMT